MYTKPTQSFTAILKIIAFIQNRLKRKTEMPLLMLSIIIQIILKIIFFSLKKQPSINPILI